MVSLLMSLHGGVIGGEQTIGLDGFIVAHSHVLQQWPVMARATDVITAVAEVALRLVKPGKKVNLS